MYTKYAKEMGTTGFTVNAVTDKDGKLVSIEAASMVDSLEIASEIAARFPKSVKVRGQRISGLDDHLKPFKAGWVSFRANLWANGVTGARNETSEKRIRNFFLHCEKLGLVLRFEDTHCLNQIKDRAEVERQLSR